MRLGLIDSPVAPGVYFNRACKNSSSVVAFSEFLNGSRPYTQTPWLWNADLMTIAPYLFFANQEQKYVRVWQDVGGGEVVALDIAFPPRPASCGPSFKLPSSVGKELDLADFYHDPTKSLVLCLHGLNGGSNEKYINDFVARAHQEGRTVVVHVARGMSNTPHHKVCFNGANHNDITHTIKTLHAGLGNNSSEAFSALVAANVQKRIADFQFIAKDECFDKDVMLVTEPTWTTPIALVGFSMGSILGTKTVAVNGLRAGVSGFTGFCGATLIFRNNTQNDWEVPLQGVVCGGLKQLFLLPNYHIVSDQYSPQPIDALSVARACTIGLFDTHFSSRFHGYSDVIDFYNDESLFWQNRQHSLAVPTLLVNSIDDPLVGIRGNCRLPAFAEQSEFLINLVTPSGGHVAYPEGLNPLTKGFGYMSGCALQFINAVET